MKKSVSIIAMCIGIILFIVGIFTEIPHKELTTYTLLSDDYSVIEEYVGGDAYNYIIGASLVGGEIAGAMAQKAVFISVGLLIFVLGLFVFSFPFKNIHKNTEEIISLSSPQLQIVENSQDNLNIPENTLTEENNDQIKENI